MKIIRSSWVRCKPDVAILGQTLHSHIQGSLHTLLCPPLGEKQQVKEKAPHMRRALRWQHALSYTSALCKDINDISASAPMREDEYSECPTAENICKEIYH